MKVLEKRPIVDTLPMLEKGKSYHYVTDTEGMLSGLSLFLAIPRKHLCLSSLVSLFANWHKQAGVLVKLSKIASESSQKSLNIEKETFSTKNVVFLTYESQNAYLSGSNLPLQKQNRSTAAAKTLGGVKRVFMQQQLSK